MPPLCPICPYRYVYSISTASSQDWRQTAVKGIENYLVLRLPNTIIAVLLEGDCINKTLCYLWYPAGRGGPSLTPAQADEDSSLYQEYSANTYTTCQVHQDLYR